jgi:hypothetical protein
MHPVRSRGFPLASALAIAGLVLLVGFGGGAAGQTENGAEPPAAEQPAARPSVAPATPEPAAPPAPTALRATPINAIMVRVDWIDNSRNETGFSIEVQSSWGGFTAGAVVNATSLTIGTLQPSTQHCFAVAAVNDVGPSARSTVCTVTPREVEPASFAR